MKEYQYELLVEDNTPYLINLLNGVKEYKVVCIDRNETLIKIEGLIFEDSIRKYVTDIKGFDYTKMRNILPECYI